MDEHHTQGRSLPDPLVSDIVRHLFEIVGRGIPPLALAVAVIFLARRLSGALARPPQPSLLVSVAATAALVAWLWSICRNSSHPQRVRVTDRILAVVLAVALMTLGACLSLPGTWPLELAIAWILLIGSLWPLYSVLRTARPVMNGWPWREMIGHSHDRGSRSSWSRWTLWRQSRASLTTDKTPQENGRTDYLTAHTGNMSHAVDVIEAVGQRDADLQRVTQRLTRLWNAEQGESIYGTMRASFAPNQRDAVLHVAFCPPFARVPQLDLEQREGPEAQLKVGQLLAYGARIDVRLRRVPPEATSVVVHLSVRELPAEDN